jgi:hypothetical protein
MKSIGGMSHGNKKQIGAMADKQHELKIGEMAPKEYKEDKKALQVHADLAKLAKK